MSSFKFLPEPAARFGMQRDTMEWDFSIIEHFVHHFLIYAIWDHQGSNPIAAPYPGGGCILTYPEFVIVYIAYPLEDLRVILLRWIGE